MRAGCRELQSAVQQEYRGSLPSQGKLKLLYQDIDGDWMLMHHADSWPCVLATATRVLVSSTG